MRGSSVDSPNRWFKYKTKQECIPVGCVPAARRPYAGGCFPGGVSGPGGSGPGGVSGPGGGVSALGGVWCLVLGGVCSQGGYPSMH